MWTRCGSEHKELLTCDGCLRSELDYVDFKNRCELRKMWRNDDEHGLILCEECKPLDESETV
jgi:hypothetical protein